MKKKIIPGQAKLNTAAKALKKKCVPAEDLLWLKLKKRQVWGYNFLRQKPTGRYLLDFYCPELSLALAVDGDVACCRDYLDYRQADLKQQGIEIISFSDETVNRNIEGVIVAIEEWIDKHKK
ncbi:MAG: endonuclease domain-containing protein [Planctomycetes bacterium]|nr:endonuclease domain-containing protein [Planctomycetota bacterium]